LLVWGVLEELDSQSPAASRQSSTGDRQSPAVSSNKKGKESR
jgi:hypothetical protein